MREPIKYDFFHGLDGLGDVPEAEPAASSLTKQPEDDIAVVGLLRAARDFEGELTLVALGELRGYGRGRVGGFVWEGACVLGGGDHGDVVRSCAGHVSCDCHCRSAHPHCTLCHLQAR